jgi:hypothetical protein
MKKPVAKCGIGLGETITTPQPCPVFIDLSTPLNGIPSQHLLHRLFRPYRISTTCGLVTLEAGYSTAVGER